jgi:hypothetical protein
MNMFEYVAVLTSIIVGLGIAQLLQGMARLIQHPEEARLYWIHVTWAIYMFLLTVFWWWWEFKLVDVEVWTFQLYLFVVLFAVVLYLLCALLFPPNLVGYDGFKDYFYSRRAWFFGLMAFIRFVDLLDSWLKGAEHLASLGVEYVVAVTVHLLLFLVAMRTRNERFHAVVAVSVLAYLLSWALRLYETVG